MDAQQVSPIPQLKFDDHQHTMTGMTPFKEPQRLALLPSHHLSHSTLTYELACEALQLRPCYRLHSRILKHTQVTGRMRAKLRVFLMAECAKQWFFRETCVLACTLADLYFLREGRVEVEQVQSLMIGCLIVAVKMREGLFPFISERAFQRQELLDFEKRVITTLAFNINPPTYYSYAQRIVCLWDEYTKKKNVYNYKIAHQPQGANIKLRRFYEQLDCVYMALGTLDYEVEEIVLNLFYLHARMLNVYEIDNHWALTDQQFTMFFYPPNDAFLSFYKQFTGRHWKGVVDECVGCYLRQFLMIGGVKEEWVLGDTRQHYQTIRVWDEVQTLPSDCYNTVKKILAFIKHRP